MLKVGIIGCGKIADSHAAQIQRIANCEIVGVCDREPLMARQLQERFQVQASFADATTMLREASPTVVHITTPPQSHYPLARLCLESGCNVYVEKPSTLDAIEAEELIEIADSTGLRITVGHDDQFSPVARRTRQIVASGYLGGAPIHIESHYGYELSGNYARALLGDKNHWVRRLPGGLLQNVISHGVARIAEFLSADAPDVVARGFVSPMLRDLGETSIVDELRVIVSDEGARTAYFTFSSQIRPILHQLRLYGCQNGLALDEHKQTLIRLHGCRFKSHAERFLPPVRFAAQYVHNAWQNLKTFATADLHFKAGMKYLIESFYRSVQEGSPLPITYKEILRNSRIMDAIVDQLSNASRD